MKEDIDFAIEDAVIKEREAIGEWLVKKQVNGPYCHVTIQELEALLRGERP